MKTSTRSLLLVTVVLASASALGQTNVVYAWRNFVGQPGGFGSANGTANEARFYYPNGVAVDSAGNVYVADRGNNTIRKLTKDGVVTTLAGSAGQPGSDDGTGSAARFNYPTSVAVDSTDNVYVADSGNSTIRKVSSAGVVTTLAGSAGQPGSDDGTGSAARFRGPAGVAVDTAGNVYVADWSDCTIRQVTPAGVVTTLAGSAGQVGSEDGTGSEARFRNPAGLAVDSAGSLVVADAYNSTIRRVTSVGVVTTLAGSAGQSGSADGTGSEARFNGPMSVTVDNAGNVLVADTSNHTIRKVTSDGVVTTLVGSAGLSGSADGAGGAARFYYPEGVALDGEGNVYVADAYNSTIRKVTSSGVVTTAAGHAAETGSADGLGSAARFYWPHGAAVDGAGNVSVADTWNNTIRRVTPAGAVTTLAGTAGLSGTNDDTGVAARFSGPSGMAMDSAGNVYVADRDNHIVRKVTSAGVVTTLAGTGGVSGTNDGPGSAAQFNFPWGVAVDSAGNVYVADENNSVIRKVTSTGVVTTLAGSPGNAGTTDGPGSTAQFMSPEGVAVDGAGNVYVADYGAHTIRKVTGAGIVTTLAGLAGASGSTDGTGGAARFNNPRGVAVDSAGNVYVADWGNQLIRRVTSGGVVTTIGGAAGVVGGGDGIGTEAKFYYPSGIAVDSAGCLYVADTFNNRISKGTPLPIMGIRRSGESVIVSWPSPSTGFVLQENADVANAAGWSASDYPITDDGTNKNVTIPSPTGRRFFRLSTAPSPVLNISRSGNSVIVSWPSSATGFALQQNADPGNAAGWSASGHPIADDGTTQSITIQSPTGNLFFRLTGN